MFIGGVLCSFSAHVGRKRTKRTPHGGMGRVSRIKKRTCRIFIRFNSPSPVSPNPFCLEGRINLQHDSPRVSLEFLTVCYYSTATSSTFFWGSFLPSFFSKKRKPHPRASPINQNLKNLSVSFLTSPDCGRITAIFIIVIIPRARSANSHAQEGVEIAPMKIKRL